jgi:hypothetical protein
MLKARVMKMVSCEVTDAEVEVAVRLLAGTDEQLAVELTTSWMWTEVHPDMPWVRPRMRRDAEVITMLAGMWRGDLDAIARVRKMADTSKCKLHCSLHGGNNQYLSLAKTPSGQEIGSLNG